MEKTFAFKDAHINYHLQGEGKTLLLVHGFGETSKIWQQQAAYLSKYFRVITPDVPGSGRSTMLKDGLVKIEDYAECMYALLQEEKVEKCVMIGHSMGGYITLAFADRFPGMLEGFGWVNSTAFADNEEKVKNRQRGIEMMKEYGGYAFLKSIIPGLFGKQFKEAHPEVIDKLIEEGHAFETEALIQYYTAMQMRPDRTHVLKAATVPVLIVAGEEDGAAPLQDVLQQAHLANTTHFHLLDKVGHMSMLEAPDEVNEFVRKVISG